MKTVSVELGMRLGSAGLAWEPKLYDKYFLPGDFGETFIKCIISEEEIITAKKLIEVGHPVAWLPTLPDLLAEIDARGYWVMIYNVPGVQWKIDLTPLGKSHISRTEKAKTAKEAAGHALLWVLKQENEK